VLVDLVERVSKWVFQHAPKLWLKVWDVVWNWRYCSKCKGKIRWSHILIVATAISLIVDSTLVAGIFLLLAQVATLVEE
jgi:cytochrome c oxidase subunit IV